MRLVRRCHVGSRAAACAPCTACRAERHASRSSVVPKACLFVVRCLGSGGIGLGL